MNTRLKIILIIVAIPIVIYFWPSALGGDTTILVVHGQSMYPNILPGSLVIIKEGPPYKVDDVVAFTQTEGRASKIIVHRIIDVTENGFIIKGDNNPQKDPGTPTEDMILGRAILATPYVGDMLTLLRNPIFLLISGIVMAGIQMEQKRRREKKEKLRRARLGLPLMEPKKKESKKPKKPDYTLLFAAIGFNIMTYIATQFTIASGIRPKGDAITGFLYNYLEVSFASTLIFALYFVFILGLYFLAKIYEVKNYQKISHMRSSNSELKLQIHKKSNTALTAASFLWLMFVLMSLYHLITIGKDLSTVL